MNREAYNIFSKGKIGNLTLPNRLIRSATWDPSILGTRRMSDEVLGLYRQVAQGGVGLIITGDFPVVPDDMYEGEDAGLKTFSYDDVRIEGLGRLVNVVHDSAPGCKIVAQLSRGYGPGPSRIPSPFLREEELLHPLTAKEIHRLVDCFIEAIIWIKEEGFDGVQLHAAHGGLLSQFLSPYTNRRDDQYGGSLQNRARIVTQIVSRAKAKVDDFPILIKMNCTDYVEGGTDIDTFPALAAEIAGSGVDAIEVSGGMWDCLVRSEEELGFRPVPAPESHTRIKSPEKQSYFLKYARSLGLDIPVILVGGNRDIERLEQIVRQGQVDLIALCRPLICEPDLPRRWLEGRGSSTAECISCNSCIYDMIMHPGRKDPGLVTCVFKHDKEKHKEAQQWLVSWVEKNTTHRENDNTLIRPFRPEEQAAAQRLIVAGLAEHFGFLDPTANPDLDDIASTYADGTFLLAWREGELVGTGALIHEEEDVGRIVRMSVAPHLRRRGIGTLILEHLFEHARAAGYHQIVLETTATWGGVIAFYQRNGFRPIGSWDCDTHLVLDLNSLDVSDQ